MRVKLAARGAGRWQSSGGYRSKFGLRANEILMALEELKKRGMEDCFTLLHFHLGSQITNIRQVKAALNEAGRVYTELVHRGAGLKYMDVGGGLGVDYDGSQTNFESSMNYTLEEYARDVVYSIQSVCDDAGVAHPNIISESGRAISAFHSVLVFSVLGVSQQGSETSADNLTPAEEADQSLHDLHQTYRGINQRNALESYHDAQQAIDTVMTLFNTGHMPLDQRCMAENIYFAICNKIWTLTSSMEYVPEELERLDRRGMRCSATSPAIRTEKLISSLIDATCDEL
jgi:arginine decarboxylase